MLPSILTSFAISLFLSLSGVDALSSLRIGIALFIQIVPGMIFWVTLTPKRETSTIELIALGIAFGTLASLISEIGLRGSKVNFLPALLPAIIACVLFFIPKVNTKIHQLEIMQPASKDLAFVAASGLAAISILWVWVLPLVIVPFCLLNIRHSRKGYFFACLSITSIVFSQLLRSSSTIWWLFSHDQLYLEGFSESIYRYGPKENIHLLGYGFPYHWFSLLWSSALTHTANLAPLISLTKVLPIVSLLTCVILVWTIGIRLNRLTAYISVLFFVLASNAINWTAIRFINSPTFIFSLIWMLAFVFTLQLWFAQKSIILNLVLGIFLIGSFGGKVTHGIVLIGGLCFLTLRTLLRKDLRRFLPNFIHLAAVLIFATSVVYFFVYRGEQVGGRMLYIRPGELGFQVGIAYMSSIRLVWIIATIAVLVGCSSYLFIALFYKTKNDFEFMFHSFCIGSFLVSLVLTFFLAQEGGSQGYFLLSSSVICIFPAAHALSEKLTELKRLLTSPLLISVITISLIFSICTVLFRNSTPLGFDPYRSSLIIKISLLSIPAIVLFLVPIISGKRFRTIGVLALAFIGLSTGIFHRIDISKNYFQNFNQLEKVEPIGGTAFRHEALNWLRNNSDEDDIVAVNRFCIPNVEPCEKKWYLVSAISRRRVLIEGYGYGLPVGTGVTVANERMFNSIEFSGNPNVKNWTYLRSLNVKWFVVDVAGEASASSWEPYATIQFENSEMKILKLADHL